MSSTPAHVLRHGPLTAYIQPLDDCPDLQALVEQIPSGAPVIWLDSARSHPSTGRWSLLGFDPWLTLITRGEHLELRTSADTHTWRGHPLDALRQVLRRYQAPAKTISQRRAIGLMGFLSYDLNRWIERLPAPRLARQTGLRSSGQTIPEMVWCGMKTLVLVDHLEQRSWIVSIADPHSPSSLARREAIAALERTTAMLAAGPVLPPAPASVASAPLVATSTQREFEMMVARALEYIRAGDIFQANVAQRLTATWRGPSTSLYRALRRVNPSPFACFLSWEDLSVVSCSPERLVRVQDGRIGTRPIAGTRPRGATPDDDAMYSLELLLSEKERAEHIMLVDLERNDLGRVCRAGSVSVDELMSLEAYSHVMHIVSDITGIVRRGVDAVDVIRAVFPGGTITGCPKVRCMQILHELEPVARGLYTGSLGYLGFDGTMDLNIAIRTMVIQGTQLSFHVGSGIVADSDPTREYHETLAKAGALISALDAVGAHPASCDAATC